MKVEYNGYVVEGTAKEIKQLVRESHHKKRGKYKKRNKVELELGIDRRKTKMSPEHRAAIGAAVRKAWKEKNK